MNIHEHPRPVQHRVARCFQAGGPGASWAPARPNGSPGETDANAVARGVSKSHLGPFSRISAWAHEPV